MAFGRSMSSTIRIHVGALLAVLCVVGLSHAQAPINSPQPAAEAVPLPPGYFVGWCGHKDHFFSQEAATFRLYDKTARRLAEFPFPLPKQFRCDPESRKAVFFDPRTKAVTSFDTESSATTSIGTVKDISSTSEISVSPNGKLVAHPIGAVPIFENSALALVPMPGRAFHWKADSQMVLAIARPELDARNPAYAERVIVRDVVNNRTYGGNLPAGYIFFQHAVFADNGIEVTLFLKPGREDIPGNVFKCKLEPFECKRVFSGVDDVSFSEDGTVALVIAKYSRPPQASDPHSYVLPDGYFVRILRKDSKAVFEQEYSAMSYAGVRARLAPSGRHAALTWIIVQSRCKGSGGTLPCEAGSIIELGGK
jgi:hypothetical protein